MKDLHQVFTEGKGPETLSQELTIYRNYGFSLADLPADKRVTLWHGLADNIVPAGDGLDRWPRRCRTARRILSRAATSWRWISPARSSPG